jgi:hypothetical protein
MLRFLAAIVTAVLIFQAPLFALAQSQEPGTIIVTVTDESTGKPIADADVFLLGGDTPQNSLTNAKGLLIFEGLQPAIYRITVEADGYKTSASTDVEVDEGQRVDVAVKMAPRNLVKTIAAVVAHSTTSVSVESVDQNSAQLKVSESLSDALNRIAGVSVDTNLYGADSAFNISLRGADASRTSYSIDGMHLGGAASQAIGGFQDLFSGGSVNFAPTAMSTAGNVNFYTIQPTKLWNYSFSGLVGNYGNSSAAWTVTGGAGKAAFALEHTAGGKDSPLSGMYYADQTGSTYLHQGGYARIANMLKTSLALSPVSSLKYTLMTGTNRSSYICANDTTLLPCSSGPGNMMNGSNTMYTLAFSSLAGHVQYNVFTNRGDYRFSDAEPNLSFDGKLVPSFASGEFPFRNAGVYLSSTARRHTISGGAYAESDRNLNTSTFNSTQNVTSTRLNRNSSIWLDDRVKANDKLAIDYTLSQAAGTGAGSSLEFYPSVTWQPKRVDVFEAGFGVGSAEPSWGAGTIGDAASGQYDCYNGSVYVDGPPDQAVKQSSLQYNLSWRHTIKNGFISASLYRNDFGGQSMRAGVPFGAEPPSLFPGGPATYLSEIEQIWSQPTVCGSTPFDPSRVYVTQNISGVSQVSQGLDLSGQIPLGRNVVAIPSYAVTNSYISSLDPRLVAPGSYYAVGAQLPHVPLHTANIIFDGHLTHSGLEWLLDAQYTSANNGNNLPAHTIYNAGILWNTPHGTIRLLEANIFGTGTGLFTTYEGVNPMPLQGGGSFAYATTPLQPRSFTVQYQVRWHQHQSPPKQKGGNAKPVH